MTLPKPLNFQITNLLFVAILLLSSCKNGNNDSTNPNGLEVNSEIPPFGSKNALSEILSNSTNDEFFVIDSLKEFYMEREYSPAWSNPEPVSYTHLTLPTTPYV